MSFVAESQRLWLQPLSISDHVEGYLMLNSDERVVGGSHRNPITTIQEAEALMRTRLPSENEPWRENYAILLRPAPGDTTRAKAVMIGVVGTPRLAEDISGVEVGYSLHPMFWGKGYATEALRLFVKHYFGSYRKYQKETLKAHTVIDNVASQKVLAKVGFVREETIGNFEAMNPKTGEKEMEQFYGWQLRRLKV